MRAICRAPASVYLIATGHRGPTGIYICSEYRGFNVGWRELYWDYGLGVASAAWLASRGRAEDFSFRLRIGFGFGER